MKIASQPTDITSCGWVSSPVAHVSCQLACKGTRAGPPYAFLEQIDGKSESSRSWLAWGQANELPWKMTATLG